MKRLGFFILLVLVLALTLALAGCGGKPVPTAPPAPAPKAETPVLDFLAANEQGASATLDDPEFGKGVRVLVEGRFQSASGEECKRATLMAENREAEVVVVCRRPDGSWHLMPRIWGQSVSQ